MPKKLSQQEFIAKCVAVHGDKYDYSETEYLGNDKPITYRCRVHKSVVQRANDHLSKKAGCPACKGVKRMTKDDFVTRANAVHGGKYTYKKAIYKNSMTKCEIDCAEHGSFWQSPHDHLEGHGCAKCAGLHPLGTEEFIRRAIAVHGDKYGYANAEYTNALGLVKIWCNKHEYEFEQKAINHLSGRGCPICGGVKHRTTKDFIASARAAHGDRYSYNKSVFVNKTTNITITCKKHKDFDQLPHNHLRGAGCPSCASVDKSRQERMLCDALSEFSPVSDRKVLGGKELDLYFPEHNLAVEVNGIRWHNDDEVSDLYHAGKTSGCSEKGITLLHFTDTQINRNSPIVLSMIRHHLGVSKKIHARKCELRQVPHAEQMDFFNANHISGGVTARHCYGLYLNSILVSAMSFSASRYAKEYQWEIIRFATILGNTVVGGASKLLKRFVSEHNPDSVMSFADAMYGDGGVYEAIGMKYVRDTAVGYSYYHSDGRVVKRVAAQKHKLQKLLGDKFDASKTEQENMKASSFFRLYDCGHKVFALVR